MVRTINLKNSTTVLKFIARAIASTDHPLLAHLVVTRRCNLSCAYCNEYDKISAPIPLDVMKNRISALANLKTEAITCTGGEPLLHPNIEAIIMANVRTPDERRGDLGAQIAANRRARECIAGLQQLPRRRWPEPPTHSRVRPHRPQPALLPE